MTRSSVLVSVVAALTLFRPAASAPWQWPWPIFNPDPLDCAVETFHDLLEENPKASVEAVVAVPQGGSYGEGSGNVAYPISPLNLPELCAVTIKVVSSSSSSYRFGLFLPSAAKWNSRFLAVGNGGFAGGINWLDMAVGPHYGFATVSTDTGHNSTVTNLTWALNSPQKQTDWGWRAMHGSVVLGKKLTAGYYGRRLKYSYYSGCSTGGRQGLKEVQEFPDSFDGVLVGAPAWHTSSANNYVTKLGMYNLPVDAPNYIATSLFPAIAAEVVRQCDPVDGVTDGIVSTLDECKFDYEKIKCGNPGVNASACLTDTQIQTAKLVNSDYYYANGTFINSGYSLSSERQWNTEIGVKEPSAFGVGYQRYFVLNDSNWDWHNYNDSIVDIARRIEPGQATADKYNIMPFKKRGGKMFMYHGIADAIVPPRETTLYYNRTIQAFGGLGKTTDFFRLFLVPGMQHCYSTVTDAPWAIAGAYQAGFVGNDTWSVPGFQDKEHDALLALMDWVERRRPINSIIATAWKSVGNATSGVLRQRPLCPWPKKSRYDNKGDVNTASSWYCK